MESLLYQKQSDISCITPNPPTVTEICVGKNESKHCFIEVIGLCITVLRKYIDFKEKHIFEKVNKSAQFKVYVELVLS